VEQFGVAIGAYDGHTLNAQLEQAAFLMQETGCKPATVFVDLGYRGVLTLPDSGL
jgi:hypothetical protein